MCIEQRTQTRGQHISPASLHASSRARAPQREQGRPRRRARVLVEEPRLDVLQAPDGADVRVELAVLQLAVGVRHEGEALREGHHEEGQEVEGEGGRAATGEEKAVLADELVPLGVREGEKVALRVDDRVERVHVAIVASELEAARRLSEDRAQADVVGLGERVELRVLLLVRDLLVAKARVHEKDGVARVDYQGGVRLALDGVHGAPPTYIAVRCGGSWWYGELILSLEASYLGAEELCYVRWLDTVAMRARVEQRTLTAQEAAGPFEAFRWSTSPGSRYYGHPRGGSAHYGVVSCSCVRYRVPMQASILDEPGAADPLFRLNTDMYRFSTS